MITIAIVNGRQTAEVLARLDGNITERREGLFRSLGDDLVRDVQRRIRTSDGGRWAKASKWLRAKTGQSKVLLGAEKYVRASITRSRVAIVGKGGKWTLDMHHHGFQNDLVGSNERLDDFGRVVLRLKDGQPLGIKAKVFAFIPMRAGHTPPRKIWPDKEEADRIIEPVASRWLRQMAKDAGADV